MTTLQPIHDLLAERRAELDEAQKRAAESQREVSRLRFECQRIESGLSCACVLDIAITDHAVARYCERVLGFDPKTLAALVNEKVEPFVRCLGDGTYPLVPGFKAVVKNRTVVSVLPA